MHTHFDVRPRTRIVSMFALSLSFFACSGGGESSDPRLEALLADPRFEVHGGEVYFEGDIMLGPVERVLEQIEHSDLAVEVPGQGTQAAGVFDRSERFQGKSTQFPASSGTPWPNNTVRWRFELNNGLAAAKRTDFLNVIGHYNARTSLFFEQVSDTFTGDFIEVNDDDTGDTGCASPLGRQGGKQLLKVGRSTGCPFGSMLHEMGHSLGLIHEHQRPDRDNFVIVTGTGVQYDKEPASAVSMFGSYDTGSIMHYGTQLTDLRGNPVVANRTALSDHDIRGIQIMYGAQFQSTVSAVSWGANRIDYFMRTTNGSVQHRAFDGVWHGLGNLGGTILGAPEAVARASNRLDLFVRGTNRQLFHKSWNGSAWVPSTTTWTGIGGTATLAGDPAVVAPTSSRIDVFAKHDDSTVKQLTWNGSTWGSWQNLGGDVVGPVEAVSWASNRIDVFATGRNRQVLHKFWNGSTWSPSQTTWNDLGASVQGKISAVSWGSGRLDIVARGTNGILLWRAIQSTSMGSWGTLDNGPVIGHPVIESWSSNRLDVFFQGSDGSLRTKWWNGSSWQPENSNVSLGGVLVGAPEVISWGSGRLNLLVRSTDDAIWHKFYDTQWRPSQTGFDFQGGVISW